MKRELNIYSNLLKPEFFNEIFKNFTIIFKKLGAVQVDIRKNKPNIVFVDKKDKVSEDFFNNLNNEFIVFTNVVPLNKNKSQAKIITTPINVDNLKNEIISFLNNKKLSIYDIQVAENFLKNITSNSQIKITNMEKEILVHLIENRSLTRKAVKEKILQIKETVETNAIDNHLSRIRKKLKLINSNTKIISKKETLLINF